MFACCGMARKSVIGCCNKQQRPLGFRIGELSCCGSCFGCKHAPAFIIVLVCWHGGAPTTPKDTTGEGRECSQVLHLSVEITLASTRAEHWRGQRADQATLPNRLRWSGALRAFPAGSAGGPPALSACAAAGHVSFRHRRFCHRARTSSRRSVPNRIRRGRRPCLQYAGDR
jgi:hypothetical protein